MSETPATYMGETQEKNTYEIRDEAPHDHFATIPNIVDDMKLSPQAYRLYGHLKRVAGDTGKCWQSTKTLAGACRMSTGAVSAAKQELENTYPPLIRIVSKQREGGEFYHEIYVTDIWRINHDNYTGKPVHIVNEVARSYSEQARSYSETKNIPIKQEEPTGEKKTISNDGNADWLDGLIQLAAMPGAKKETVKKGYAAMLESKLHINPSGKRWEEFVGFAADRLAKNKEPLDKFLAWALTNGYDPRYWTPDKMRELWPQAFIQGNNKLGAAPQKPQRLPSGL